MEKILRTWNPVTARDWTRLIAHFGENKKGTNILNPSQIDIEFLLEKPIEYILSYPLPFPLPFLASIPTKFHKGRTKLRGEGESYKETQTLWI